MLIMKSDICTEIVSYTCESVACKGYLASPKSPHRHPGILIAPAWKGLDTFARKKAESLADLGYTAFAADLYGGGVVVESNEEAAALMQPLFVDRSLLQKRIFAAFEALKNNPLVDPEKIGAIGFCFGGLTVIELLRSGAPLAGIVTFHALLGDRLGDLNAKPAKRDPAANSKLLILHGYQDPLVSPSDITTMQKELTNASVDWQMSIYGQAYHAFTDPKAHDKLHGLIYDQKSECRSWQAMRNFFEEVLL